MRRNQRGQLFVLAAVALAAMIIAVTVLLNSGVYAANLSAHQDAAGVDEPREFLREAEIGANRIMAYTNHNTNSSYATLKSNFTVGVRNWSRLAHHHAALEGDGVSVSAEGVTNGSRISQSAWNRSFTNASDAANWTLGAGVGGVRQFRMNLSVATLQNDTSVTNQSHYRNSSYFRVAVTTSGGATTRRIYVYRNQPSAATDRVLVRVGGPSGLSAPCSVPVNDDGRVPLHLTDGLIGGEHCFPLTFLQDPAVPLTIGYTNGDAIGGAYALYVNETYSQLDDSDFATPPPRLDRAIYEADLAVSFLDGTTRVNGSRLARPDRRRPAPVEPPNAPTPTVTPTSTPSPTVTPTATSTP